MTSTEQCFFQLPEIYNSGSLWARRVSFRLVISGYFFHKWIIYLCVCEFIYGYGTKSKSNILCSSSLTCCQSYFPFKPLLMHLQNFQEKKCIVHAILSQSEHLKTNLWFKGDNVANSEAHKFTCIAFLSVGICLSQWPFCVLR